MSDRKRFTAPSIKSLEDGKHPDPSTTGLYLWVRGNSRTWQYRYSRNGVANTISLGSLKDVGLAAARDKAIEHRATLINGGDPKKPVVPDSPAPTFREDAKAYYQHINREWRSVAYGRDWWASLERHVFPHIGDRPTHEVTIAEIVEVVRPLWGKLAKADVILDRVKLIIAHALDNDDNNRFAFGNPADRVRSRLPKGISKPVVAHPALPHSLAPVLYAKLTAMHSQPAKALRLLLLCCTPRAAEIVGAKWSYFDLDAAIYHVPASLMKSGKARDIPLTRAALDLLATIERTDGFVFTGRPGKWTGFEGTSRKRVGGTYVSFNGHMQRDAMQLLLQELMPGYHVHGLRSTFRGWVSEHAQTVRDHDAAELSLDHTIGNRVHRAYDRADMICERRALAERWAQFLMK
jgi:integrase